MTKELYSWFKIWIKTNLLSFKKSKTEVTASVQENKSKRQRMPKIHDLICLVDIKAFIFNLFICVEKELRRTFTFLDRESFLKFYTDLVRPHLEYGNCVLICVINCE